MQKLTFILGSFFVAIVLLATILTSFSRTPGNRVKAESIVDIRQTAVIPPGTEQDFDISGSGSVYISDSHTIPVVEAQILSGGPNDSGQFLRLGFDTPVPNHTSISFDRTNSGSYDLIVTDFDFRITPGAGRADGFGFALLNTAVPTYGISGAIEPGPPMYAAEEPQFESSLGIGFDIYQNVGEENNNHVSVYFDGTELTTVNVSSLGLNMTSGQWIHARIIMRPGGGYNDLSLMLKPCGGRGITILENYLVAGFTPYEARLRFAARSGGESANHDIDNIHTQYLNLNDSVVSFVNNCPSVMETVENIAIEVSRTGIVASGTMSVAYETSDGSAQAGSDYEATSGILNFGSDEITKSITIPITDDGFDEGDETFFVTLSSVSGDFDILGGPRTTKVTIADDERAQVAGHWDEVIPSDVIPIQTMLLPTGRVMYWDREGPNDEWDKGPRIWDPISDLISETVDVDYELFCAGHSFMEDGRLLVSGGHIADGNGDDAAGIYDPFNDSWEILPNMNHGRWYPSNVTLPNGNILVSAGTYTDGLNTIPQIWNVDDSQWISLTGAPLGPYPLFADYYPYLYVAPNGKVFDAGPQQVARYLDTTGAGSWTDVATSTIAYRDYGSSVMYDDGKVMIVGGSSRAYEAPTASAELINLNDPNPVWQATDSMNYGRRHHNATLLPDGQVLVTGGSNGAGFDNQTAPALAAEMWNPNDGTWTVLAEQTLYRGYHSVALLLPDGRVLVGGGGHPDPGGIPQYNFEIFSPPYLFKGERPTINSAPTSVVYGETFFISTANGAEIENVNWIRLSAVTHAFNQNQRINRLSFSLTAGGLEVQAPFDPNLAPPGHYLLFILDEEGIPSEAKIIQITDDASPELGVSKQASHDPVRVGTSVTYNYLITNTGNVILSQIEATDDKLGDLTLPTSTLLPNESMTTSISYTIVEADLPGPLTNTVSVTANGAAQNVVTSDIETITLLDHFKIYLPVVLKP